MKNKTLQIINLLLLFVILFCSLRMLWCYGIGLDERMTIDEFFEYTRIYTLTNAASAIVLIVVNGVSFLKSNKRIN